MSQQLAEKWWGVAAVPISMGGAGSLSNTTTLGPRPTSVPSGILIHAAVWSQYTWAKKWGAAVPLSRGGAAASPSKIKWPGLTTSIPSGILIRPTVWPQYTNVTDRQTGQRFDSTGRTFYKRSPNKNEDQLTSKFGRLVEQRRNKQSK